MPLSEARFSLKSFPSAAQAFKSLAGVVDVVGSGVQNFTDGGGVAGVDGFGVGIASGAAIVRRRHWQRDQPACMRQHKVESRATRKIRAVTRVRMKSSPERGGI